MKINYAEILKPYIKLLLSFLSTIPLALFPVVFLYSHNTDYAALSDVIYITLFFIVNSAICYLFFSLCTGNCWAGAILSDLTLLFILNYNAIELVITAYFYNLRLWHIMAVAVFILINLVILFRKYKKSEEIVTKFSIVIAVVFSGLIIFNLFTVAPSIYKQIYLLFIDRSGPNVSNNKIEEKISLEEKPNFYYIILDEFSPSSTLKEFFGYDTFEFKEFLTDKKFSLSNTSKNTSLRTPVITANLLNLNYVVESVVNSFPDAYRQRQNSKLVESFNNAGYTTYTIERNLSSDWYIKNSQISITSDGDSLTNFKNVFLAQTIFKYSIKEGNKKWEIMKAFDEIEAISGNNQKPKFVFTHILSPHYPYVFTQENTVKLTDNSSKENDNNAYLNEYLYIENRTKILIDTIIQNDPDSVIVIQSDHGFRYTDTPEMGHNIFNTVYFGGESFDSIEGLSGVNTLRKIVARVLKIDLPIITDLDYRPVEHRSFNTLEEG